MEHVSGLCTFEEMERVASKKCSGAGHGFIEISGVRRPIVLEMTVIRKNSHYHVKGHTALKWSDFGVEDPSILVAYLNETVNIEVEVKIPVAHGQR
jgi:polyisoprenoid-binding protein YceI